MPPRGWRISRRIPPYTPGQFTDVPADAWYAGSVQSAVEYGLMKGGSDGTFDPSGTISIAEALALACRIHSAYYDNGAEFVQGSPWYQVYVDYALENEIIDSYFVSYCDFNSAAARQRFATILGRTMPESALPAMNSITDIPGVGEELEYGVEKEKITLLYNAGILTGSDEYGTFDAKGSISRSEVATIITRMVEPALRKRFTLTPAPAAVAGDLTLADFNGIWRHESDDSTSEYIFSDGQFESVTYNKTPSDDDYGPYWYSSGTVQFGKNVYSSYMNVTFPYVLDLYAKESYDTKSYSTNGDPTARSFSVKEVNIGAGYLIDRYGTRWEKATTSLYRDTIKPMADTARAAATAAAQAEKEAVAAAVLDGENYAYRALKYIYDHLKFPSTMEVLEVRTGPYDRIKDYEGAPEFMKPSGAILSLTDDYYVVTMKVKAANSLGQMVTDSYVSLYNLTSGKTYHDLEGYAKGFVDDAWGAKKIQWMDVESEAILVSAMITFPELPRETVERIVNEIKG